jgi:2,4-dienoyl-CoA reductase-like NADH-dependent reductase (Old Yellow Enzyme family)
MGFLIEPAGMGENLIASSTSRDSCEYAMSLDISQEAALAAPTASLFKPFKINSLEIENRIVMAPMTRRFSPGGIPGDGVAAYYRRRAEGGVGVIITEGTFIDHPSAGDATNVPRAYGDLAMRGWNNVVREVRAANGRIMAQLWHIGTMSLGPKGIRPTKLIGPSGLDTSGRQVAEPATNAEIEEIIAGYQRSAQAVKLAGFDGIELHAAHGYLIDQFLWEKTNRRSDVWGGDLVGRTRFAVEVIRACRSVVGADFPISFRFSQWKLNDYHARLAHSPAQLEKLLAPLAKAGVDIFHCSTRRFWEAEFPGSTLNLAGWTKKISGLAVITVGSITLDKDFRDANSIARPRNIAAAVGMVDRGEVDLIAVGRSLLADPSWAFKVKSGQEGSMLSFDNSLKDTLT